MQVGEILCTVYCYFPIFMLRNLAKLASFYLMFNIIINMKNSIGSSSLIIHLLQVEVILAKVTF